MRWRQRGNKVVAHCGCSANTERKHAANEWAETLSSGCREFQHLICWMSKLTFIASKKINTHIRSDVILCVCVCLGSFPSLFPHIPEWRTGSDTQTSCPLSLSLSFVHWWPHYKAANHRSPCSMHNGSSGPGVWRPLLLVSDYLCYKKTCKPVSRVLGSKLAHDTCRWPQQQPTSPDVCWTVRNAVLLTLPLSLVVKHCKNNLIKVALLSRCLVCHILIS